MTNTKVKFDEWRKEYEAADKQTRAIMWANREKENMEKIKRAIDNVDRLRLGESLQGDDSKNLAADIHTVISAARDYLQIEQAHKWQMQLLQSEWKLLHQFIVEQARRIGKVKDIAELNDAMFSLGCYANCYLEGLLNPVPHEFKYLEFLAREPRDDIEKDIRARLAKEHIYIKESGEMIIDEKARARRKEWGTDQSE